MGERVVLQARSLEQRLRGRLVLAGCTFSLGPGVTALLGPNGAGKSVLLRTLAGILPWTGGGLYLDGEPARARQLRRLVASVSQFPGVHPWLGVRGHLERAAAWSGRPQPAAAAAAALERLGLQREAGTLAGRVPLPVRRRLAVAEAWVRGCRILLLDEPTADLHPEERAAFWDEVGSLLRPGPGDDGGLVAVMVTTHLLGEVAAHCDAVLLLAQGRIRFAGAPAALAAQAAGACLRIPPAAPAAAGWLEVGVGVEGWRDVVAVPGGAAGGGGVRSQPAGGVARPPTLLDGYLRVVRGGGGP